ncbi:MAG: family 43 glycosylhydrolase [Spirochaetaceae bacterium]|jgi:beta-fructofuranosidase|nr:family 43 glycosylhydrolase [Spirochaetaceae bacterium]
MNIFYRPKNAWVGDCIPYWEDGCYYIFYLHDPRNVAGKYAENTTWHLLTSPDLIKFEERGEAIERGAGNQPNKNIYTGSICRGKDGEYYAFYTAVNEALSVNGKIRQSIMYAKGETLFHLATDESFILYADDEIYESFDWRDPFVFWNDNDQQYWMLLAARLKGAGGHRGGCIGLCTSKDLKIWNYQKPLYAPNMYITMECPEVFFQNGWWYMVFSTFSDRFVTHYRMARNLLGPWTIPVDDVFDCRANYALKTASDGKKRFSFGWIASKTGETDQGDWEWGGTMAIHEIKQNADGLFHTAPPPALVSYYHHKREISAWILFNAERIQTNKGVDFCTDTLGAALCKIPEDNFAIDVELTVEGGTEYGIALHTEPDMERGYFLRMDPASGLVAWDIWPRKEQGFYQWQIAGDKPYQMETCRRFIPQRTNHIQIIREREITVVYINGKTALSSPLYNFKGGYGGPYVIQGLVHIGDCTISTP